MSPDTPHRGTEMIRPEIFSLEVSALCLEQTRKSHQLVMNFVVMPTFFLSGALFPLTNVPRALQVIASIDPLSYGVDGLRSMLTGLSHFGVGTDFAVLSVLTAVFLLSGSYLFSRIQL